MSDTQATSPFVLVRLGSHDWLVQDHRYDVHDHQHAFAAVHHGEDDFIEVVWIHQTPLPQIYATVEDVLSDLERWWRRHEGAARKPIPIPHLRPLGAQSPA
jgi:hypothetical protein